MNVAVWVSGVADSVNYNNDCGMKCTRIENRLSKMNEETAAVRVMIIMRMMTTALSVWQHIGKQMKTNKLHRTWRSVLNLECTVSSFNTF